MPHSEGQADLALQDFISCKHDGAIEYMITPGQETLLEQHFHLHRLPIHECRYILRTDIEQVEETI